MFAVGAVCWLTRSVSNKAGERLDEVSSWSYENYFVRLVGKLFLDGGSSDLSSL